MIKIVNGDKQIVIGPQQYRHLLVSAYEDKQIPWDEVFMRLFNSGWRGRVDKHGFPVNLRSIRP